MIFWDKDGVICDIYSLIFKREPVSWHEKTEEGKTLIEAINDDPSLLLKAKPLEYLQVLNDQPEVRILSAQPPKWQPNAMKWLREYITTDFRVTFASSPSDKLSHLRDGDILIDDYPFFRSYEKVWLITRDYNKGIKVEDAVRIDSTSELREKIREYNGGKV